MARGDDSFMPVNPNILFDLRQTYAMQILTPILIQIEEFRDRNMYQQWFEKLTMGLFINVYQKLDEDEREEYKEKKNKTLKILNENPSVYKGIDKQNPERNYKVKTALIELELWLKDKMEKHGLYGKGSEYDADEI
jgi:hypothetical protein